MLVSAGNCHLLGATSSSLPPPFHSTHTHSLSFYHSSLPLFHSLFLSPSSFPSLTASFYLSLSYSLRSARSYPLLYARRLSKSPATGRKLFRKHFTIESSTGSRVLLFTRIVVLGPAGNPSLSLSFSPSSSIHTSVSRVACCRACCNSRAKNCARSKRLAATRDFCSFEGRRSISVEQPSPVKCLICRRNVNSNSSGERCTADGSRGRKEDAG